MRVYARHMNRFLLRLFLTGIVVLAGPGAFAGPACVGNPELKPLQPLTVQTAKGEHRFLVEVADTDRERELGLMCRRSLAADRGMLFDFGRERPDTAFWMRNTLIPLDIIYIRRDGVVRSIVRNARPLDETPRPAGGPILGVLELAGGRAAQIGLQPGDRIVFPIFRGRP
ncbi:MAG: DUF192 domain-containing protein [Phenylobacterium sp.]